MIVAALLLGAIAGVALGNLVQYLYVAHTQHTKPRRQSKLDHVVVDEEAPASPRRARNNSTPSGT